MSPAGRARCLLWRQRGNWSASREIFNTRSSNRQNQNSLPLLSVQSNQIVQPHPGYPHYDIQFKAQFSRYSPAKPTTRLSTQPPYSAQQYFWQSHDLSNKNWIRVPKFSNIFSLLWKSKNQQKTSQPQQQQSDQKVVPVRTYENGEEVSELSTLNPSFQLSEDQIVNMSNEEFEQTMQDMLDSGASLSHKLRAAVLDKFMANLLELSPRGITLGVKCAASLPLHLTKLMYEQISGIIFLGIGEYKTQDRIDLIAAFAKLQLRNDQLLDVMGKWLAHEAKSVDPNVLCQTLDCYEKLGYYHHKTLRDAIVEVSAVKIADLTPESIALLLSTLAKFNQSDTLIDVLLDTMVIDVQKRLEQFDARHFVDIIWGFAKLHHRGESCRPLITQVVKKLITTTGDLAPQYLPKLIWGLSRVDKDLSRRDIFLEIFSVIAYRAIRHMKLFQKQEVLELAEGIKGVRYLNDELLKVVYNRLWTIKDTLNVNDVANILDVYAFFGVKLKQDFFDFAYEAIISNGQELTIDSVCCSLWSLSLFDSLPVNVYQKLIQRLDDVDYGLGLEPLALQKLFKANALIKLQYNKQDVLPLPDNFKRLADQAWEDRLFRSYHISRAELEITDILRDMGIKVEVEKTINKILMVDLEIFVSGKGKAVVEIDGPRRFTINKPFLPLGDTMWSRRLLREFGYRLIVVCTHEWKELTSWSAKQQKIRELIDKL
eukprot:TRINITY_DN1572_c0_g2_i1.p1 TRINITY_DN1572_c0_g2~~TRINITY_DN1572_c0_g2_i1.p1  ORF type:complete len:711 (-),score=59.05 TRINITY_DN1572_c0_g2_i1:206-2338(-)